MPTALAVPLVAAGQSLVIYAFLVVALCRTGRQQMAQLTLVAYLIIALLGSAVEAGLYAGSRSLAAGLTAAATLLVANRALRFLIGRSTLVRRLVIGTPIVLVQDGQVVPSQLRRSGLSRQELLEAIRMRGYGSVDDVRFAVLEVDGSIGVVGKRSAAT